MHGYKTYEAKINNPFISDEELKKINYEEKLLFRNIDKIFCVSEKFMEFMKKKEPEFKDKFDYNFNPIDFEKIQSISRKHKKPKKNNQIVSIGGGMRQKNNLMVCEAINKLNYEKGLDLKFTVIGLPYTDKDKICSYDFVTYYDELPHEKVIEILSESYLYIQNSTFETFGIAIIEALLCRCNLLLSDNIGATGVIRTIEDDDLIFDTQSIDEIAKKIERVMTNNNYQRLVSGILKDEIQFNKSAELLKIKITKHVGDKIE